MLSLDLSGLNLHFKKKEKTLVLIDENDQREYNPNIRRLKDMKELFFNSQIEKNPETVLYYMYRQINRKKDEEALKKNKLRYDITIIPPALLRGEFIKTAGHYHPIAKENLSYPEIYEVIEGEGLFFLQKETEFAGNKKIKSIFLLGKPGELVFIPPNYGHITINLSNAVLCMANWVSSVFKSEYRNIKEKKGGAFYVLKKNNTGFKLEKNSNYNNYKIDSLFASPKKAEFFGFEDKTPMYEFIKNPEKLSFLNDPTLCPNLDYE